MGTFYFTFFLTEIYEFFCTCLLHFIFLGYRWINLTIFFRRKKEFDSQFYPLCFDLNFIISKSGLIPSLCFLGGSLFGSFPSFLSWELNYPLLSSLFQKAWQIFRFLEECLYASCIKLGCTLSSSLKNAFSY